MKIFTIVIAALALSMFGVSNSRAGETATDAMLRTESLGGLRLGLPEKDVVKLLTGRIGVVSKHSTCRIHPIVKRLAL